MQGAGVVVVAKIVEAKLQLTRGQRFVAATAADRNRPPLANAELEIRFADARARAGRQTVGVDLTGEDTDDDGAGSAHGDEVALVDGELRRRPVAVAGGDGEGDVADPERLRTYRRARDKDERESNRQAELSYHHRISVRPNENPGSEFPTCAGHARGRHGWPAW